MTQVSSSSMKENNNNNDFWTKLDAIDKRLSSPFFNAKLSLVLEYILSIPGNFFGLPVFSLLITPNLHARNFGIIVGILSISTLVLWFAALNGHKNFINQRNSIISGFVAPMGSIVLLLTLIENEDARKVGFFQLASWSISMIPVAFLKSRVGRLRPICCKELPPAKKHLTIIQEELIHESPTSSFPSGDSAGAMATVFPLLYDYSEWTWLGIVCVLLSCCGRMYWKAHHWGDVIAGAVLSWSCCLLLYYFVDEPRTCRIRWYHALIAHMTLIVYVKLRKKLLSRRKDKAKFLY